MAKPPTPKPAKLIAKASWLTKPDNLQALNAQPFYPKHLLPVISSQTLEFGLKQPTSPQRATAKVENAGPEGYKDCGFGGIVIVCGFEGLMRAGRTEL